MQIKVRVTPNSRAASVSRLDDGSYAVKVDAPAVDGKANERLLRILAEHFNLKKSAVRMVSGSKGRNKVVDIGA